MPDEASGKSYELKAEPASYSVSFSTKIDLQIITYPQKLLAVAQSLIDTGEYSISIVVSHIACEVAIDRAFTNSFRAKGLEYLEAPIEMLLSGNNLGNDKRRSSTLP